MKRAELFNYLEKAEDPVKDHQLILSNFHYTHYYLMDRYKKLLSRHNLTAIQSNILGIISYFRPGVATLEQIKEMVLEPNSDVSRTVTRLVEKGFAEKLADKENRRKVSIKITQEGLKAITRVSNAGEFEKFTSKLTREEVKIFIRVLAKLRTGSPV